MSDRHAIIIDTDPGQDDAIALLLAFASPEIDIRAITTVAGNVPLDLTTKNALKICELASRTDVPVHAGAPRPLVHDLVTAEHVHGRTGLDGPDLPEPAITIEAENAVDVIIREAHAAGEAGLTLCVLGPMTNIALALIRDPSIAPNIARIIAMGGGCFEGGNITPAAEFNIYVDPHAARVVFESGIAITLAPLDVTHKALTTQARVDALTACNTPVCDAAASLIGFFERFDEEKYGTDGAPLHDPCVIAWLLEPDMFTGKDCHVAIETVSELTRGMTVIDWWGVTGKPANAHVLGGIDADRFFALITERLSRL